MLASSAKLIDKIEENPELDLTWGELSLYSAFSAFLCATFWTVSRAVLSDGHKFVAHVGQPSAYNFTA